MNFELNGFKKARLRTGMTQEVAADKIGVTRPTIAQWERGVNIPTKNNLAKIAEAYNCTIDELLEERKECG